MSETRKLGRAEIVATVGNSIPSGQRKPSGTCTGEILSPRPASPGQPPQTRSSTGAAGSTDRGGGDIPRPASPVNSRGSTQLKGKRSGQAKIKPCAGAAPKKRRSAKGGSVPVPTVPASVPEGRTAEGVSGPEITWPDPGTYAAQLQSEGYYLTDSARPCPPGVVAKPTIVQDGLLYGLVDRATPSPASAMGALSTGHCTYGMHRAAP